MFNNSILPSILRTHFLDLGLENFFNKVIHKFNPINTHDQSYQGTIQEGMCFRKAIDRSTNEVYFDVEVTEVYMCIVGDPTKGEAIGKVAFFAFCYGNSSDRAWSEEGTKTGYIGAIEDMTFFEPYEEPHEPDPD